MSNFSKMLHVFVLSLTPWFCYFLALNISTLSPRDSIAVVGAMWMLVSPVLMMIIAAVAYREGQWSAQDKLEKSPK